MIDDRDFQRLTAWGAIVSAPLALACNVLTLAAVDFDLGATADPRALLTTGAHGGALWRGAMLAALFGYYLLVAPLFALLARHWRVRGDLGRLLGACGFAYAAIGALGAVILAAAMPPILAAYAAEPAQRGALTVVFDTLTNVVYVGMWNSLATILGGIAWLGFGAMLRLERPALAGLTTTLGVASLVGAAATIVGLHLVALGALSLYLVLAPVWALWAGWDALGAVRRATSSLPHMTVFAR
jgi:hypothetical protein